MNWIITIRPHCSFTRRFSQKWSEFPCKVEKCIENNMQNMKVARPCSTSAVHVHHTAALINFNYRSCMLLWIVLFETRQPLCQHHFFPPLSLLSSSFQLHVARSVSQWVRQSGASGPLRLRLPPQLSKAETRRCGHAILAAVVGFHQPAFEHNTSRVADT